MTHTGSLSPSVMKPMETLDIVLPSSSLWWTTGVSGGKDSSSEISSPTVFMMFSSMMVDMKKPPRWRAKNDIIAFRIFLCCLSLPSFLGKLDSSVPLQEY